VQIPAAQAKRSLAMERKLPKRMAALSLGVMKLTEQKLRRGHYP
jgi:hypothetical protein